MLQDHSKPPVNLLLASLPLAVAAQLVPLLKVVSLPQGEVLNEPGDEIDQVYFPHSGMISLLAVMTDGKAVETATVGGEGALGVMAGLGLHIMLTRAVVQLPLVASKIAAPAFRKVVQAHNGLRDVIVRYNEALFVQVQMTAACNALHPIKARLARWILQAQDRYFGDVVPLTQELLSEMLGVRRSSIGEIASRLQADGVIRYSRGNILIIDRTALEGSACECYETIRNATALMQR